MDRKGFEEIVVKRTDVRLQEKIKTARIGVIKALYPLLGKQGSACYLGDQSRVRAYLKDLKPFLTILVSDNPFKGWPKELWERERGAVTGELFSVMDEMQKALLSPALDKEAEDYDHPSVEESDKEEPCQSPL